MVVLAERFDTPSTLSVDAPVTVSVPILALAATSVDTVMFSEFPVSITVIHSVPLYICSSSESSK